MTVTASEGGRVYSGVERAAVLMMLVGEEEASAILQKLEPDAQLPSFAFSRTGPETATMTYRSQRALPDLAEGLPVGCLAHFGHQASVRREDRSGGAGTLVDFHVERRTDS